MAEARRVIPDIDFNGKSAKKSLDGLTEQIEYDDVASGASDTLSIQVFNKDMKFLKGWLPKKGDRITAKKHGREDPEGQPERTGGIPGYWRQNHGLQ